MVTFEKCHHLQAHVVGVRWGGCRHRDAWMAHLRESTALSQNSPPAQPRNRDRGTDGELAALREGRELTEQL